MRDRSSAVACFVGPSVPSDSVVLMNPLQLRAGEIGSVLPTYAAFRTQCFEITCRLMKVSFLTLTEDVDFHFWSHFLTQFCIFRSSFFFLDGSSVASRNLKRWLSSRAIFLARSLDVVDIARVLSTRLHPAPDSGCGGRAVLVNALVRVIT